MAASILNFSCRWLLLLLAATYLVAESECVAYRVAYETGAKQKVRRALRWIQQRPRSSRRRAACNLVHGRAKGSPEEH
jgi:hypothetical protein